MLERPPNARLEVHVGLGIVLHRESRSWNVLVTQRQADTHLAGLWEFPGGKIEQGESPAQCVVRELYEEVALRITPLRVLHPVEHTYEHARIVLHPWLCARNAGQVQLRSVAAYQWIDPAFLTTLHFPPANQPILNEIDRLFTSGDLFNQMPVK